MFTSLINTDFNFVFSTPWFHESIIPPSITAIPTVSLDLPSMQRWIGYDLSGSHTTTVLHQFHNIILEGHNVGLGIGHVTYPPSVLMAVHTAFSERKTNFSSSKVHMDNKPVACAGQCSGFYPMTDCGDPVANPLSVIPINHFNTVAVGMTLLDLVAGAIGILIDLILDIIFFKLAGPAAPVADKLTKKLLDAVLPKLLPFMDIKSAIKFVLKTVESAVLDIIKALDADGSDDVSMKFKVIGHSNVAQLDVEVGLFGTHYSTRATLPSQSKNQPSGNTPPVQGNPQPEPIATNNSDSTVLE